MKQVHIENDTWNIRIGKHFAEMRLEGTNTKYCPSKFQMAQLLNLKSYLPNDAFCECCSGRDYRITPMDVTHYLMRIHYGDDISEILRERSTMPIPRIV